MYQFLLDWISDNYVDKYLEAGGCVPNEAVSPLLVVQAAGDELEAGVLGARQLLVLEHAHGRRGGRLARAAAHHPALAPSK